MDDNKLQEARVKINRIDKEMAALFEERMKAVEDVASYKAEHNLPIFDSQREQEVISKNSEYIKNSELKEYYIDFLNHTMKVSKDYQKKMLNL